MKNSLLLVLSLLFLLIACNKNDDSSSDGQYSNSVFVINEGPYPTGTGTITAYNRETGTTSHDIFEAVNGRPLGNIVQSMTIYKDEAWIMVNNSGKIEVVTAYDFKSVATIDSIGSPRFAVIKDQKAYVSSWNDKIYIIDTDNYQIIDEIPTGTGPDELVIIGENLFTVNTGGWGTDNSITWANISNISETGEMVLADRPCSLVKDKNQDLWVLCSGRGWNGFPDPSTDTKGKLVCIDPETRAVIHEYEFPSSEIHPDNLIISGNGSELYFTLPNGIYTLPVDNPVLPSSPFIEAELMYYGLGFDPVSGLLFATDPLDFAQNGYVYLFNADNGTAISSFQTGLAPNGFCFSE